MIDLSKIMISVSGVRGKLQDGFDPNVIFQFSRAFAASVQGDLVVVGRDSRPSGVFIESILTGAILASGKNVLSLGIVPTPTVKAVVQAKKAGAGVIVTASHNPLEWNAFKFVGKQGFFYSQQEIDQVLLNLKNNSYPAVDPMSAPKWEQSYHETKLHLDSVLSRIDVLAIRNKKYKVLLDAVNGAGSSLVPEFLELLGCDVYKINCTPDGIFPRPPEPTEDALIETSREVKKLGVDIGFALDPDADRLVVLTPEKGAISEEYTVPLSLMAVIPEFVGKARVVLNESSSFLSDKVVNAYGGTVIRSKVGEANVVAQMIESKAMFGGEGNGGVIDPKINSFGRDSLAGIGHILNLMAKENLPIDAIHNKLPELFMKKTKFPREGAKVEDLFRKLESGFPDGTVSKLDGMRISWDYGWIHLRPSNTEPIVRIIAEAKSEEQLDELLLKTEKTLS
jgi:phosphomannomutase